MNKIFALILSSSVLIIVLYYSLMFYSTNQIKNQVESLLKGEILTEETQEQVVDVYNRIEDMSRPDGRAAVKKSADVTRLFVLHNFFDGYMWVQYSYEARDADDALLCGTAKATARWKIHRQNGKWEIVEIIEKP